MKRAALVVALGLTSLARTAHADDWEDAIKKGKQEEKANETDEERARRQDRVDREAVAAGADLRGRIYLFAGVGVMHAGEYENPDAKLCTPNCGDLPEKEHPIADPGFAIEVGPAINFFLTSSVALQGRLGFLFGPAVTSENVSHANYQSGLTVVRNAEAGPLFGGTLDATARYYLGPNVFFGAGPFAAVVKGHDSTVMTAGGLVAEAGVRFGPSHEFELLARPALGGGTAGLYGQHFLSFGWSPAGWAPMTSQ